MASIKQRIISLNKRGLQYWLPSYLANTMFSFDEPASNGPVHIMFCFVDHYEPTAKDGGNLGPEARVHEWVDRYPKMAQQHKDADGNHPQHGWFYPPHQDHKFLKDLVGLCHARLGEIEMHLHHNHMPPFPDTSSTLKAKILKCIDDYSKLGIFCLPDGSRKFAFIHGDWSLDNARGSRFCGVNDEITILQECGCFADLTFPSLGEAQPKMINAIYYCHDDPNRPKSYNTGMLLRADTASQSGLLMIPGIIGMRWKSRTHAWVPSIEASNIDISDKPFKERVDYWVRNAVRIPGRPNWRFIKIHTHGARDIDFDCFFGERAHDMHGYLESRYNDGNNYRLHYVTAREIYNICKAAESGNDGDPNTYRNFEIPRYVYNI